MKPLLPTLKEKKRYIAYEIQTLRPAGKDLSHILVTELERLLGLFGAAEAGLQRISYDTKKQSGVIRASLKSMPKVRAALTLITELDKIKVRIIVKKVSGILNKASKQ